MGNVSVRTNRFEGGFCSLDGGVVFADEEAAGS